MDGILPCRQELRLAELEQPARLHAAARHRLEVFRIGVCAQVKDALVLDHERPDIVTGHRIPVPVGGMRRICNRLFAVAADLEPTAERLLVGAELNAPAKDKRRATRPVVVAAMNETELSPALLGDIRRSREIVHAHLNVFTDIVHDARRQVHVGRETEQARILGNRDVHGVDARRTRGTERDLI